MSSFAQKFTEDRRLVILRFLAKCEGYTANEFMVKEAVANYGHSVSRDKLRTDLAWLQEQGLVTLTIANTTQVAHLTARGGDVASGEVTVPGVKRPLPGDL